MKRRLAALAAAVALGTAVSTTSVTPAKADPSAGVMLGAGAAAVILSNYIFDLPDHDEGVDFVHGGVGWFDAVQQDNQSVEFRAEYWGPWRFLKFYPYGGVFGNTDGGFGGYIGVRQDLYLTENFVLSMRTAPTFYNAADGPHLGSYAVLRSGFDIAYRFDNRVRVALSVDHMSHGELFDDKNPGTETIALTVAVPVDALSGY